VNLEDLELYPLLNAGLDLYHQGKPFEAHEIWEYAWNGEVGRTKLTLQALIQIAAALHKRNTNNPRGTSKLFAKAKDKIEEIRTGASAFLGIDLVALSRDVEVSLAAADRWSAGGPQEVPAPHLPKRTGSDGVLYLHGYASGPTSHKASVIVPALRERGFHVEVPDLNEDDFQNLTISRALALAKRGLRDRTLVIGSSLGGYLATLLAANDDRAKGLLLMAPAYDFAERMKLRHGEGVRGHVLYEDALKYPGRPKIRVPTYMLMGLRDDVVSPQIVSETAAANAALVELALVDDDHGLVASAGLARDKALAMIERLRFSPDAAPPDAEEILRLLEEPKD
jgi:pimeloyl-ACP methyl ester carboxylesterase